MLVEEIVDLSRLQFALTALYHFIFVPLTLGLSVILVIMESVYVMTNKEIWRDMVKFWGVLFGINFAMGVATGITMEFQFGTNWSFYSHYVGDIFGAPLAIEGMMAFFLEATFIGLFFFGWDRLSPRKHLLSTFCLALGTNLSALWILIANGWMQHPVGAEFNLDTMRMEVANFYEIIFNPVAQAKFVHTISAGYVTGAMFVLSISAYYLLKGRNLELAKRSMAVAAAFGLASALSVVVLGDESGYVSNDSQKMKLAAMEGMWETEPAPASLNLIGIPDQEARTTHYEIKIPYVLGLIATRSFSQPIEGINELVDNNKDRIKQGIVAYRALNNLKSNRQDQVALQTFKENSEYLGYGLLLKRYVEDITTADEALINKAAWDTVPRVAPLFWSFRVMVLCGLYFIALFAYAFYNVSNRNFNNKFFLRTCFYSLPLPWLAAELGWIVAEYGRQPWVIEGILPTFLGASNLSFGQVATSLGGFVLFYTLLLVVELFLMVKYIKKGPEGIFSYEWQSRN